MSCNVVTHRAGVEQQHFDLSVVIWIHGVGHNLDITFEDHS